jgi:hypothetical protein
VPRTHNNEVNAAQSPLLNNNQLLFKKLYISKPLRRNKKGIRLKKTKSSFNYKAEWDTLGLLNRAHHLQVNSAAVASADKIAINEAPLVISPTKEDSTSDPEPQHLSQEGWV